ncbi:MAG: glycosyltransferase family 4 protein [Candidatus Schekmanbacteria bacterium]|nr:glycosyltransferase family 4 protein [Candidatus Schekmanbacteria bacterium]
MLTESIKRKLDHYSNHRRYYLNACGDKLGPNIFGKRLKSELKKLGWIYDPKVFDYNLAFITGTYYPNKVNILRLDGLYFDTEHTLGDNTQLNAPLKKAYAEFDKIIFQSEFSRKMFFEHFGYADKPHRIIYNGVPETFSPAGAKYKYPFGKTLICSAKWRAHKRLAAIIEGFKRLKMADVGLVVLGETPPVGPHKNIIFLNEIPQHKLPFYLRGADAFVHLCWLDCCPNSVIEALACGLPVLCNHNGGTKELVKDSGIIMEFEETYNFRPVTLYKPPMPDPRLVARGMAALLEWNKPVIRPDLYIDRVAKQYVEFFLE